MNVGFDPTAKALTRIYKGTYVDQNGQERYFVIEVNDKMKAKFRIYPQTHRRIERGLKSIGTRAIFRQIGVELARNAVLNVKTYQEATTDNKGLEIHRLKLRNSDEEPVVVAIQKVRPQQAQPPGALAPVKKYVVDGQAYYMTVFSSIAFQEATIGADIDKALNAPEVELKVVTPEAEIAVARKEKVPEIIPMAQLLADLREVREQAKALADMTPDAFCALLAKGQLYNRAVGEKFFRHYISDDLVGFDRAFRQYAMKLAKLH